MAQAQLHPRTQKAATLFCDALRERGGHVAVKLETHAFVACKVSASAVLVCFTSMHAANRLPYSSSFVTVSPEPTNGIVYAGVRLMNIVAAAFLAKVASSGLQIGDVCPLPTVR